MVAREIGALSQDLESFRILMQSRLLIVSFKIPKASLPKVNDCRQRKLIGRRRNLFLNPFFLGDTREQGHQRNWTLHLPVAKWQTTSEMMMHCRGCPSQLPPNVPLGKLGACYNVYPPSSLLASQPPIRKRKNLGSSRDSWIKVRF